MHGPVTTVLAEMTLAVVWLHLLVIAVVKLLRSQHLRDLREMASAMVAQLSSRYWTAMGRRPLSPSRRRAAAIFDLFFDYVAVTLFGLSALAFFAAFIEAELARDPVLAVVFGVYAFGTSIVTRMFVEHARRDRNMFLALWYPTRVPVIEV